MLGNTAGFGFNAGSLTLIADGHSLRAGETLDSFGQVFGRVTRVAFP